MLDLIAAAVIMTSMAAALPAAPAIPDAEAAPAFSRTEDIVYARPDGVALTMDRFVPASGANGKIVAVIVSGGWFSSHGAIDAKNAGGIVRVLLTHGYSVYAIVHRSSPRFTIEDAVADVGRAIRVIRQREAEDGWTSVSIGVTGGSAGGHLSLMAGTTGDDGNPAAQDPVERASSRVNAVACYFPPTDFLNYGAPRINVLETTVGQLFPASFDFQRQESVPGAGVLRSAKYSDVTDAGELKKILREVSPASHVSADDAPTLIIQGNADPLVPWQQAKLMVDKLKANGVDAELITRDGAGHGWAGIEKDHEELVRWFDAHL